MFLSGMIINLHSDSILRNLRKPGESGYKIPYGKLVFRNFNIFNLKDVMSRARGLPVSLPVQMSK